MNFEFRFITRKPCCKKYVFSFLGGCSFQDFNFPRRNNFFGNLRICSISTLLLTVLLVGFSKSFAADSSKPIDLNELCKENLNGFPGKKDDKLIAASCGKVKVNDDCQSVNNVPLYHYEKQGSLKSPSKILVLSLIHGDETAAGSVARYWMERLESIEPRNNWRVIPVLNPDGYKNKTRTNAHKVDVNRNFPTKDWDEKAQVYWKRETGSNPRRYPGDISASEPETKCALKHIDDFKPDFIVSIHTPLKVLDFDGPKFKPPKFDYLPWKTLGHYPGSLGRYMWFERQVPVLTMELKEDLPKSNQTWGKLQDIIGVLVGLEAETKKPTSYGKNEFSN